MDIGRVTAIVEVIDLNEPAGLVEDELVTAPPVAAPVLAEV